MVALNGSNKTAVDNRAILWGDELRAEGDGVGLAGSDDDLHGEFGIVTGAPIGQSGQSLAQFADLGREAHANDVGQLFGPTRIEDKPQSLRYRGLVFRLDHALEFTGAQDRQERPDGFRRAFNSTQAGWIPNQVKGRCLRGADPKRRHGSGWLLRGRSLNPALDEKPDSNPSHLDDPARPVGHHLRDLQRLRV